MKVIVIADDFSGAAEMAGIALRYGLKLNVCLNSLEMLKSPPPFGGDVGFVVCTDSRSLKKDEAIAVTKKIVKEVLQLEPEWMYKKTDSVLRGHIVDELKTQMQLTGKRKAFFMPANPSLGRTINKGKYFVNNVPLNETGFANDPEFPVKSSLVKEVLQNEVEVLTLKDMLPDEGIVVGEVNSADDYKHWAAKANDSWLLSGTGDFFTALLEKQFKQSAIAAPELQQPFLYVCGTAFTERKAAIKKIAAEKNSVCYLNSENETEVISKAITTSKTAPAILAFDDVDFSLSAAELRQWMAAVVKKIIEAAAIKELFIEGGSTAAAILQELNIKMLQPLNELSKGVVRMKDDDLFITVKPGSYQLPNEITKLFS
jgi:D-threonate/D-erythronate kinase